MYTAKKLENYSNGIPQNIYGNGYMEIKNNNDTNNIDILKSPNDTDILETPNDTDILETPNDTDILETPSGRNKDSADYTLLCNASEVQQQTGDTERKSDGSSSECVSDNSWMETDRLETTV